MHRLRSENVSILTKALYESLSKNKLLEYLILFFP